MSANLGSFIPLRAGDFALVWWDIGNGTGPEVLLVRGEYAVTYRDRNIVGMLTATTVVTAYSKSAARSSKHCWVESSTSLGTLSYISVQVFTQFMGERYFSLSSCGSLSTATFIHVPPTHFLLSLAPLQNAIEVTEGLALGNITDFTVAVLCQNSSRLLNSIRARGQDVDRCVGQLCKDLKRANPTGNRVHMQEDHSSEEDDVFDDDSDSESDI